MNLSKEEQALFNEAFAPGTSGAQALLIAARKLGVASRFKQQVVGLSIHDRMILEGQRQAGIEILQAAGLDPMTAVKPPRARKP